MALQIPRHGAGRPGCMEEDFAGPDRQTTQVAVVTRGILWGLSSPFSSDPRPPTCGLGARGRGPWPGAAIARPELRYALSFAETSDHSLKSVHEPFCEKIGMRGKPKSTQYRWAEIDGSPVINPDSGGGLGIPGVPATLLRPEPRDIAAMERWREVTRTPYCGALHSRTVFCTALHRAAHYCTELHCTPLQSTTLCCIVLS
jgi:hypothetical protein